MMRDICDKIAKHVSAITAIQFYQLMRYSVLFLIGVMLVQFDVAKTEIGHYEQFLFLAAFVSFFWLEGVVKGFLAIHDGEQKTGQFFNVFLVLKLFAFVALMLLISSQNTYLPQLLNGDQFRYLPLLGSYLLFQLPSTIAGYLLYLKQKVKALFIYGFIAFTVQFILVGAAIIFDGQLVTILRAVVISAALRYFFTWYLLIKFDRLHFNIDFTRYLLQKSWPLIAATFLAGSAQYVDGVIITSHFSTADFAVFRFGARELPLAILLAGSFSTAMISECRLEDKKQSFIEKMHAGSKQLIHLLFPVSIVLAATSHWLFRFFFNAEFDQSATIFNIYLLLLVSRLLFPQSILIGLGYERKILKVSFYELMLNVTLSLIFVRIFGIIGVALATVVAFWFEKLILSIILKRTTKIKLKDIIPINLWLIYSLVLTVVVFIVEYL